MTKVALITGGNRGIGLAISKAMLQQGYAVQILSRSELAPEVLTELQGLSEVGHTSGDVSDLTAHQRFIGDALDRWGRIDVLVNNAGVAPTSRDDILDATVESFDRVLGINLRAPYFLTQAVARQLIAQRGDGTTDTTDGIVGAIVNVASCSSTMVSFNRGEYCISKAGVSMATQLWAARLAPEGILVNEVRPGVIATEMTAGVKEKYDRQFAEGLAPMPRWGRPEDVAAAVVNLVIGSMRYSVGEVINVDGGMHIARL
ncbi:3-ketoacyl-ACP reductase [Cutibacterium acnes]|uniref:3-ketoacyl-ACP reductase n=1 Tax=Cutibacterium acnes TaxID=1747 RepID=A0AA44ZFJ3_CUTAC|nr:3-ketoacyl-ACP reductase [Cutibacterium acnes]OFQ65154.1 3-ketoacyl-ACP reductase [Propionibacterium sp. HMSC075A12]EFT09509.1 oxidoreductase, short chain dehydrogenase/reductase family protein [Cutibacterium acnes HL082PA2]MCD1081991.1 3-ketoacyl-ACP reductase [Cutibacterium acnes]MDK7569839.1 3-ketoacyl-ACP reductase [Cutibacterium acnes]MDK8279557.1 3-ketoacyl-ACP reductase [Cutibacterium acnes]